MFQKVEAPVNRRDRSTLWVPAWPLTVSSPQSRAVCQVAMRALPQKDPSTAMAGAAESRIEKTAISFFSFSILLNAFVKGLTANLGLPFTRKVKLDKVCRAV